MSLSFLRLRCRHILSLLHHLPYNFYSTGPTPFIPSIYWSNSTLILYDSFLIRFHAGIFHCLDSWQRTVFWICCYFRLVDCLIVTVSKLKDKIKDKNINNSLDSILTFINLSCSHNLFVSSHLKCVSVKSRFINRIFVWDIAVVLIVISLHCFF